MADPSFTQVDFSTAQKFWDYLSPQAASMVGRSYIFRGQPDASSGLIPSALRPGGMIEERISESNKVTSAQILAEMEVLAEFARKCDDLGLSLPQDSYRLRTKLDPSVEGRGNDYIREPRTWPPIELTGLMALAQHHGIPTRLLDWSRRSHVAAYFAASSALKRRNRWGDGECLAVWALNSADLLHIDTTAESQAGKGRYPFVRLVTASGAVTANLAAQAGIFTLQIERGGMDDPIVNRGLESEFVDTPMCLWKVTLPVQECIELLRICRLYAITAATLFPRYDGASEAVLEEERVEQARLRMTAGAGRSQPK